MSFNGTGNMRFMWRETVDLLKLVKSKASSKTMSKLEVIFPGIPDQDLPLEELGRTLALSHGF